MAKKDIQSDINAFLELWSVDEIVKFLRDILDLHELYNLDSNGKDWFHEALGGDEEETKLVRLVRTVYLISRLASLYSGKLALTRTQFKDLWSRMEAETVEISRVNENGPSIQGN